MEAKACATQSKTTTRPSLPRKNGIAGPTETRRCTGSRVSAAVRLQANAPFSDLGRYRSLESINDSGSGRRGRRSS